MKRLLAFTVCAFVGACSNQSSSSSQGGSGAAATTAAPAPAPPREVPPGPKLFVSNESGGDLSVIDVATQQLVATVRVGKRPRGLRLAPDGSVLYVALSGSPIAGPGVDESKLPPPDKSADGIGVFDVSQNKLVKVIRSGSDPENFDLTKDGKTLYVSNEDIAGVSIVDLTEGK